MSPDQKAKAARILGYICLGVGALDLVIVATRPEGLSQAAWGPLGAGFGALGIGVIMVALGRGKPRP